MDGCDARSLQWSRGLAAEDFEGAAAAMHAAIHGSAECLLALIQAGVDIEAKDEFGMTVAMWAAFNGNAECLSVLIQAGADIHLMDSRGRTASMWAAIHGHGDCLAMTEAENERRALAEATRAGRAKPAMRI